MKKKQNTARIRGTPSQDYAPLSMELKKSKYSSLGSFGWLVSQHTPRPASDDVLQIIKNQLQQEVWQQSCRVKLCVSSPDTRVQASAVLSYSKHSEAYLLFLYKQDRKCRMFLWSTAVRLTATVGSCARLRKSDKVKAQMQAEWCLQTAHFGRYSFLHSQHSKC